MAIEIDMEGKDPLVYGDPFSSGHPVENDPSILLTSPKKIGLAQALMDQLRRRIEKFRSPAKLTQKIYGRSK